MEKSFDKRIVIVGGGAPAVALADSLRFHDVVACRVRATPGEGDATYLGSPADTAAALRDAKPAAIVAGSPVDQHYADALAAACGLSGWHRDGAPAPATPSAALDAVAANGIGVCPTEVFDAPEAALAWARENEAWPIAIRPDNWESLASPRTCRNAAELAAALQDVQAKSPADAGSRMPVLLQAENDGPDFLVHAISRAGRHYITEAWHLTVRSSETTMAVESLTLLSPAVPLARTLLTHALAALDACGHANGAARVAVRLTKSGPLVTDLQIGRLAPLRDMSPYHAAGIDAQSECHARLLADATGGPFGVETQSVYTFERHLAKVFLTCVHGGIVRNSDGFCRLGALFTYHSHYGVLEAGSQASVQAGVVYLAGECRNQLRQDVALLRDWERKGLLYAMEPNACRA